MTTTRRQLFALSAGSLSVVAAWPAQEVLGFEAKAPSQDGSAQPRLPYGGFPSQDPELVRQIVGVSHGNFDAVKSLVEKQRELAKATWDWGFGDWESALGAASHVGNREIAEFLVANGARPDIFTFAMLGHVDVVRAYVEALPGIQRIHGPHGITLLAHARAGKDQATSVVEYLQSVGGADEPAPSMPLDEAAKPVYIGEYRFGPGETELLVVKEQRGALFIERQGGASRSLTHIGDHRFTPAGAPSVRVIFEVEAEAATSLRIEGHSPEISAKRSL